jgi:choline dehydrogenase-like flavoprotein
MAAGAEAAGEIIVVGSGPAGVSVAFPLLAAGLRVRMLDGGAGPPRVEPPAGTIAELRGAPDRWRHQFGADLAGLFVDRALPPKPATPRARAITGTFARFAEVHADNFLPFGALSPGGLSAVWGALAPAFEARDFSGYPIALPDLEPSYAAIRARIGVAAEPPVAPQLRRLLDAHHRRPDATLRLQPAPNAVRGCVRCGLCLWGCRHDAIYDSASEVPALRQFPTFAFEPGVVVRRLLPAHGGHLLELDDNGQPRLLYASRVILAAGTLATTALVFDRVGYTDAPTRLLNNPVAAMAFAVPGRLGADLPRETFSLAQLLYEVPLSGVARSRYVVGEEVLAPGAGLTPHPDWSATRPNPPLPQGERESGEFAPSAVGALYSADALPLEIFASRLPLTRPTTLRFARALAPALVLATCYLPSRYSRNTITIARRNDKPTIVIRGETTHAARDALMLAKRHLAGGLRRLGAFALPGGFAIAVPGTDAHAAGTIPMRRDGESRATPSCNADCEVRGAPGLFVVDGAALPSLPARHCTLTIMANADRAGRTLAARITGETRLGR